MAVILPTYVQQYFWGDDLKKLSWKNHQSYIIQTLLEKGDFDAIDWLFKQVSKKELKKQLSQFKLTPKSKNFWEIYL